MTRIGLPAARPCGSCPLRADAPSGLWDATEYAKLPDFDGPTHAQPPAVFMCHQQDGRLCGGWVAVIDVGESLGLRVACAQGSLTRDDVDALAAYDAGGVPLHPSCTAAAEAGLADVAAPGPEAHRKGQRLLRRGLGLGPGRRK